MTGTGNLVTQQPTISAQGTNLITGTASLTLQPLGTSNQATPQEIKKPEVSGRQVLKYLQLKIGQSESQILLREPKLSSFLDAALESGANANTLANWVVNELGTHLRESEVARVTPAQLGELVKLIIDGTISNRIAKTVLEKTLETGIDPLEIIATEGLKQVSDSGALEPIIDAIMAANPDKVSAYKSGRTGLLGFFVGQVMAQTKGAGNPQMVQELVKQKLKT